MPKTPDATPGPWTAHGHSVMGPDGLQVCQATQFPKRDRDPAIAELNAHLISAVPELLKALKMHQDFLSSLPKGWLAKTTGDIGLLNDAYLVGVKAQRKAAGKSV